MMKIYALEIAVGLALLATQATAQVHALSASTQSITGPAAPVMTQAPEFAPGIEVEKIVFATAVSSRAPVGVSDVFDSKTGSIYCWNQLLLSRPPINIRHEWYWNDEKVGSSAFRVHFKHARVWSRHKTRPGQWRVEIRDADSGRLIAVGAFVVRKS